MQMENIERIKLSQGQLSVWQTEEHNFIPLSGCKDPNYRGTVVLEDEVNNFLDSDVQKVLLLAGHSGAGKSLYTQGLITRLWQNYREGQPIPLWIALPDCKNPEQRAIEETLEKCGFNAAQIEELRNTQKFIFIFDAYDEIHCLKNLSVTNRLSRWKAKTIITCRHEYLYSLDNFRNLFAWYESGKPNYLASAVLYVKPFNAEQIEQYVRQYITQHPDSEWQQWEQYSQALDAIPGIYELIKTPFVLKLAVEALPDIAKRYSDKESQTENKDLTRAVLYDVFVRQWFLRQELKLKANNTIPKTENIQTDMWNYVKSLAQLMHERKVSQVYYNPDDDNVFDDEAEENPFARFFDPSLPRTQIFMRSCLLREMSPKHYAFVHASLLEYFLTRDLYDATKKTEKLVIKEEKEAPKRKSDYFNERLLVEENQVIQFLSDRVDEDSQFKQEMLDRVQASKNKPENANGAANAMTILVRAGVQFNGADLSGIQIEGGNISGGYFDRANLFNANLRNTKMHHVWLRDANVEKCQLAGVNFGEYPWFKQNAEIKSFDYREDLQRLVTTNGNEIILWDSVTGEQLIILQGHEDKITSVQFNLDGKQLVSGSWDHTVRIWDLETNTVKIIFKGHNKWVQSVAFSPDGKRVVSGSYDHTIKIWEIFSKKEIATLEGHQDYVNCVRFSPNGELVVSGSQDKTVRVWELRSKKAIAIFEGHEWWVHCVAFSPDGCRVVSGSLDKTVRLWEIASKEAISVLQGHEGGVNSVQFSADGVRVLSASEDKTIRIWEVSSGDTVAVLRGHDANVLNVQFSADGERVVSGSADKTIRIWDIASGRYPARLRGHDKKVNTLQISPEGGQVLSGSLDKTIRITDLKTGKMLLQFNGHQNSVDCVAYRSDGKQFVSGGGDSVVKIWDSTSCKAKKILRGHKSTVSCVAYSHDGEWLVSGSQDKSVRVWNLNTGREHAQLKGHDRTVTCVAFHPKRNQVVSGGGDKKVKIWSIDGGDPVAILSGHKETVLCVQYSSEGECLASGSADKTIQIWDAKSGNSIAVLQGHENMVNSVQFCVGAKYIVSGSEDMTIRVWNISAAQCFSVHKLHARIGNFSIRPEGLLVVGLEDGSIECWQNKDYETDAHWNLQWSTDIDSRGLCVESLKTMDAIGLSDKNRRLLEQRGADVKAELVSSVAKRSGSPIHKHSSVATDLAQNVNKK